MESNLFDQKKELLIKKLNGLCTSNPAISSAQFIIDQLKVRISFELWASDTLWHSKRQNDVHDVTHNFD